MEQPLWPTHWTALSDLHLDAVRSSASSTHDGRFITRLRPYVHDNDGDLVLPRRSSSPSSSPPSSTTASGEAPQLVMLHAGETSMEKVGLQLWAGGLLLAEFILANPNLFASATVIELGAGLALPSLCAARAGARRVFATDYANDILANGAENIALNAEFLQGSPAPIVRQLDWRAADLFLASEHGKQWTWQLGECNELSHDIIILAADVIYDERLTDALFGVLHRLLKGESALYLSVERRINFTLEDLAPTSKQYDHFFRRVHCKEDHSHPSASLHGTRIALEQFPQRFAYERTSQLELWRLERNSIEEGDG